MNRRSIGAVVMLLVLAVPLAANSNAAKKIKQCPSGQIRRTVSYVHRTGGPVDHATGCALKRVTVPTSFAPIQRKVRALALTFVPTSVARAFRSRAARRVAATDAKTDAAIGAYAIARAPALAHPAMRDPRAHAADNGTETKQLVHYTKLDTADDIGESFETTLTTSATRVAGPQSASDMKTLKVTHLINKCPDAAGIARGTLDFSLRDLRAAGGSSIEETSKLDAQILAHFDDTAHIASVEVIGTWSFAVKTGHTSRSAGGDVAATNFRQTGGSSYVDLTTTVTTGTDDDIVTGGGPLGVWVAEALAHEYIQQMLNSIPSGVCVTIVPDSPTVHVVPGGTVAIVAHLTDHHGEAFPGSITEYNPPNRVSPTKADGNTDARFTYTAPGSAKPGETDVVQLSHVSKRGKAVGATVNVVVDGQLNTISGAFTGHATELGVIYNWTGAATFQRVVGNTGPPAAFQLTSGQATVTVSGSETGSGCDQTGSSVIGLVAGSPWTVTGAAAPFSYLFSAPFLPDAPQATNVNCSDPNQNGSPAGLGSMPAAALQSGDMAALAKVTNDLYVYSGSASATGPGSDAAASWTWSFSGSP